MDYRKNDIKTAIDDWKAPIPSFDDDFIKTSLNAMYDNTQEQLAKQGLKPDDEITLFRGVNTDIGNMQPGQSMKYKGNAAESWSLSASTASSFGHAVLMSKVKAKNILSTFASGFGCMNEQEVVILGGEGSVVVVRSK